MRWNHTPVEATSVADLARAAGTSPVVAELLLRNGLGDPGAATRFLSPALASLGDDQRRVLELAYFEGLSCSEIADRIAIPIGTVKSRLAAGLSRLREGIGGRR
jgi:DNA-directed RNA polymerase specialized sigma24 family protein